MNKNIDYKNIIRSFVGNMVNDFNNVEINVNEEEKNVTINIIADNENIARLIGKEGRVANSLREIVSIIGKDNEKFIHLYFKDKNKNNTDTKFKI